MAVALAALADRRPQVAVDHPKGEERSGELMSGGERKGEMVVGDGEDDDDDVDNRERVMVEMWVVGVVAIGG